MSSKEKDIGLSEQPGRLLGMKTGITEGVFASASDNFAGPYLALFALALGASNLQIGLVSAIPALIGAWMQLPAAWIAEKWKRRKLFMVIGGTGARVLWLLIAFIPMLQLGATRSIIVLLVLLALRSVFGALSTPTWTSIMAEMIPRGMRGTYFANRNFYVTIAALVATFGSAGLLQWFAEPTGYQVVFLIAALFGAFGGRLLAKFPDFDADARNAVQLDTAQMDAESGDVEEGRSDTEPSPSTVDASDAGQKVVKERSLARLVSNLRREKAFTTFALMAFVWNFGVSLPQPLFAVHFVESLGGTAGFWGVVTGSTLITTLIGQRYWGPITDRFGGRNVMIAAGIIATIIPALWLLTYRPGQAIWINLISGFGWAGYNLAAFNLLLEVTPDNRRSMYVAGYNGMIGISQFGGPLMGGLLADVISVQFVFGMSTIVRLAGWVLLIYTVKTVFDKPFDLKAFVPRIDVRAWIRVIANVPSAFTTKIRIRRQIAAIREKNEQKLHNRSQDHDSNVSF